MKLPNLILLLIVLIITLLIYFIFFKHPSVSLPNTVNIRLNRTDYQLEVAKSIFEKAQGLSNRKSLCSNCGMIFVFDAEGSLPFWMKDTLIPLDMVWLNTRGQVVSIQTAVPQPGVPLNKLKLYQNNQPAKYVLELNAGDAQKISLQVGDMVKLPNL